jgi:hypothetical protein
MEIGGDHRLLRPGFSRAGLAERSLYLAMAVHVVYDITAGITYGRLGKEFGYSPEIIESAATS